jgi:hypothetical protein
MGHDHGHDAPGQPEEGDQAAPATDLHHIAVGMAIRVAIATAC